MVRLTSVNCCNTVFYFHNIDECMAFRKWFDDRWCNIKWKMIIVSDNVTMSTYQRGDMEKSPEERAYENRHWGKHWGSGNAVKKEDVDLTPEQMVCIDRILDMVLGKMVD